jgi:FKBP-type peptidyl-prolyl cis-trans isomerase FklB
MKISQVSLALALACASCFAADNAAPPITANRDNLQRFQSAAANGAKTPTVTIAPQVTVAPANTNSPDQIVNEGSYALGASYGMALRTQGAEPNMEQFIKGFNDGIGGKLTIPEPQLRSNYMTWRKELQTKALEKNKKAGEEFLAKKASEPGVKKFPDGLLYKEINKGTGAQPKADDTVRAHYKGTLIDGTEFDSSYTRGQPIVTPVRGVVAGWQEALTNMHVGDKWELYIPSQLGYGERGAGAKIGPGAALIFEMELVGIEPPNTNAPGGSPTINLGNPGGNQPIRVTPNTGRPQSQPKIGVEVIK